MSFFFIHGEKYIVQQEVLRCLKKIPKIKRRIIYYLCMRMVFTISVYFSSISSKFSILTVFCEFFMLFYEQTEEEEKENKYLNCMLQTIWTIDSFVIYSARHKKYDKF